MFSTAKKQDFYASSASVVDGKLILSFPSAKIPVVWQMDLAEVKASALEVRGEKDPFTLVLRTTKSEVVDIAPFTTKEEAVAGLVAVTKALHGAHGMIRPAANTDSPSQPAPVRPQAKSGKGKWLVLFGIIAFLGFITFFMASLQPPISGVPMDASGGEMRADSQKTGVPVSADEFLNNNR